MAAIIARFLNKAQRPLSKLRCIDIRTSAYISTRFL